MSSDPFELDARPSTTVCVETSLERTSHVMILMLRNMLGTKIQGRLYAGGCSQQGPGVSKRDCSHLFTSSVEL